ncbi:MAG: ATP-binding protein [bacterium]
MKSILIGKMWNNVRVRFGFYIVLALLCLLSTFHSGCRWGLIEQDSAVWMTIVIAIASMGTLCMILIFSLQSRMIFDPLKKITEAVKKVSDGHYQSGDCLKLRWAINDEMGLFVQSVDEMALRFAEQTRALTEERDYQSALLSSIPDCVCLFDHEAKLVKMYKQPNLVAPIRGLVAGECLMPPFFLEQDCAHLQEAVGKALGTGKAQLAFVSLRETSERFRHFEVRAFNIKQGYALVVLKDITREKKESDHRKQAEGHLIRVEKIESLGTLAAGIAHDVNSMLTVIRNTLEVTWGNPIESECEGIRTILQATEKGSQLTRELMTYAGQNQIKFARSDANEIIVSMEKLLQGVMASNVILELNLGDNLPKVDADPRQFWKVLLNLLKNASEAMNGLRGAVRISTYELALTEHNKRDFFCTHSLTCEPGVVFEVSDTGIGIPKEILKRVFEPFFSTKASGRGLGLATAFGIVDTHNGAISISSEVGKGTTFRIWLPVSKIAPVETDLTKESTCAVTSRTPISGRPCVLIIEDDRSVLQTTRILLKTLGIDSLEAASKRDAIGVFGKHSERINLIFLDATIDNMNNVNLLALLRQHNPNVPVVIVSGYSEKRIADMFASQPYEGFLGKPYTRDQLITTIRPFISSL